MSTDAPGGNSRCGYRLDWMISVDDHILAPAHALRLVLEHVEDGRRCALPGLPGREQLHPADLDDAGLDLQRHPGQVPRPEGVHVGVADRVGRPALERAEYVLKVQGHWNRRYVRQGTLADHQRGDGGLIEREELLFRDERTPTEIFKDLWCSSRCSSATTR